MERTKSLIGCALLATLAWSAALAAQGNERRLRVLALLEREARRSERVAEPYLHLDDVIFGLPHQRRAVGLPCFPLPRREPLARRRALASELFAIYGLTMEPDYLLEVPGAKARLDGFDRKAKVGFMGGPAAARWGDRRRTADKLTESGYPVLLMPDGFGWEQGYAFAVSLAGPLTAFLDSATEGHDVALQTALETSYLYALHDVRWPAGVGSVHSGCCYRLKVRLTTAVQIPIDRKRVAQRVPLSKKKPAFEIASTEGRRVIISTRLGPWEQKEPQPLPIVTVSQDVADDTLHVQASDGLAIMPPAFDAAEPYWVTIELPPGTYFWNARLTIHAP